MNIKNPSTFSSTSQKTRLLSVHLAVHFQSQYISQYNKYISTKSGHPDGSAVFELRNLETGPNFDNFEVKFLKIGIFLKNGFGSNQTKNGKQSLDPFLNKI